MEHLNRIGVARIRTPHPEQAAAFLRQHLWCEPVERGQTAVRSGGFEMEFVHWDGALDSCAPDAMLCGLRHIALEADDIHEALARCRAQGLRLQTAPDGGPRLSQKVYGTGLRYFNILTEFGVVIEVTEKHPGSAPKAERPGWGLGHVGIQVPELAGSLRFYEELGFRQDFAPVKNETPDGPVDCCMVTRAGLTLELYAFTRYADAPVQTHPAFSELVISGLQNGVRGPAGEWLGKAESK